MSHSSDTTTVLIVDDSVFMRQELRKLLEKHDFDICGEAANGLEAVKFYKEHHPDIVLLDIVMPVMDGISALRTIRQYDEDALVIMISSMSIQSKVVAAARAGAKQFIVKPFKEDQIIERIQQALQTASGA